MKRISKLLIIAVWSALIYILFRLDLLTGNMDNLNQFFNICGKYKALIFIALSSLRIAALIPSAVFMILGGVIFNLVFKEHLGVTVMAYITNLKINRAKTLLTTTTKSILEISELLGFHDSSHFCKAFKKVTGVAPRKYRKR